MGKQQTNRDTAVDELQSEGQLRKNGHRGFLSNLAASQSINLQVRIEQNLSARRMLLPALQHTTSIDRRSPVTDFMPASDDTSQSSRHRDVALPAEMQFHIQKPVPCWPTLPRAVRIPHSVAARLALDYPRSSSKRQRISALLNCLLLDLLACLLGVRLMKKGTHAMVELSC